MLQKDNPDYTLINIEMPHYAYIEQLLISKRTILRAPSQKTMPTCSISALKFLKLQLFFQFMAYVFQTRLLHHYLTDTETEQQKQLSNS